MASTDVTKLMGVGVPDQVAKQLDTSYGVSVGTVAAAGSSITDATAVSSEFNKVTGADGTKGVKLPALSTVPTGKLITIVNSDTVSALKIYSNAAGETISGQAGNTAISLAAKLQLRCTKVSSTEWFAEKGVIPY
jgi:hypothetical protein